MTTEGAGDAGTTSFVLRGEVLSSLFRWSIVIAAVSAPLLWHLSCFWQIDPQYQYGWLVPPLCVYLAWRRWSTRPAVKPAPRWTLPCSIAGYMLLSVVWLIRDATPDWSVVSWALAALTVGNLFLMVARAGGLSTSRHFWFPICFLLTAVPWPHGLETVVVQQLTKFVAATAAECANWAGIAALPEGNFIHLTRGYVGISEACSGMRSLQAILMASLFLGEFRRSSILNRALLLITGVAIAILCNLARAIALVLIFARWGEEALTRWHDATGFLVLLIAFGLLGLVASWTSVWRMPGSDPDAQRDVSARGPISISMPEALGACCWAIATFAAAECWYGRPDTAPVRLVIRWPEGQRFFRFLPVPEDVRHSLLYDEGSVATWLGPDGGSWALFTFRWAPGRTATQSARLHRPENCFTASGAILQEDLGPTTIMIDGKTMTFRSYLFERNHAPVIVFYGIWEEANRDRLAGNLLQDYSGLSRLQRVVSRQRNLGQQSLEFILAGQTDFNAARAEFERALPLLVGLKST